MKCGPYFPRGVLLGSGIINYSVYYICGEFCSKALKKWREISSKETRLEYEKLRGSLPEMFVKTKFDRYALTTEE